jgi:hypothetical protein
MDAFNDTRPPQARQGERVVSLPAEALAKAGRHRGKVEMAGPTLPAQPAGLVTLEKIRFDLIPDVPNVGIIRQETNVDIVVRRDDRLSLFHVPHDMKMIGKNGESDVFGRSDQIHFDLTGRLIDGGVRRNFHGVDEVDAKLDGRPNVNGCVDD